MIILNWTSGDKFHQSTDENFLKIKKMVSIYEETYTPSIPKIRNICLKSSNQPKSKMKKSLFFILFAVLTFGFVFAEDKREKRKPGDRRNVSPEVIKKFDEDGDGKLSREEGLAARKALAQGRRQGNSDGGRRGALPPQLIKKFDKDGDGKLNEDEQAALRKAGEKRRKEFLAKFDKDGDGKLSQEERKAAGEEIRKRRGGSERNGRPRPEGRKRPGSQKPEAKEL